MRILVIEDEASLRDGIVDLLTGDGHAVTAAADGVTGLETGLRDVFDLVVLDLMLPRLDGMDVCRKLRAARPDLPILMLTARASEDDKVRGLVEGADDYVTKPFSARELLARVRALGRRAPIGESLDAVQIDGAVIDLARMAVIRGDTCLSLTPREVGILRWLHRHRGRVVSRAELLEHVFGQRGDPSAPTLVAIRRVETPDGSLTQGFVVDRRAVSTWLAARSGDMRAEVRPGSPGVPVAQGWGLSVEPNPGSLVKADEEVDAAAREFLIRFSGVGVLALFAATLIVLLVTGPSDSPASAASLRRRLTSCAHRSPACSFTATCSLTDWAIPRRCATTRVA